MNQEKQRLHCKISTIILSFISLIFSVVSSVEFFAYYEKKYTYYDEYYVLSTLSSPLEVATGLISFILRVVPVVLFIIYILKFFKDSRATIIVPIIFGYFAFSSLFSIITNIINNSIDIAPLSVVLNLFEIGVFLLATYGSLRGFSKKIFIIPILLVVVLDVFGMIGLTYSWNYIIENELYLYFLMSYGRTIASVTLYFAIFLFAIKNKIPEILSRTFRKAKEITNPEQELRLLQERFDDGTISEGEYKMQRTEIINKL